MSIKSIIINYLKICALILTVIFIFILMKWSYNNDLTNSLFTVLSIFTFITLIRIVFKLLKNKKSN